MKRFYVVLTVVFVVFCVAHAEASDMGTMKNRMWARQQQGIADLLSCFRADAETACYEDAAFKITSAEINLLAYDVDPRNPNLVLHLAGTQSGTPDFVVFAYRILKFQYSKKSGHALDPAGPFRGQRFRLRSAEERFNGIIELKDIRN